LENGSTVKGGAYIFVYQKEREIISREHYLVYDRISAVNRVAFVRDRMSYIVLRNHCFKIIVSNVHATSEETSNDSEASFCEELQQVFDNFPKYNIKIP
jgi:hypothetical protein